MLRSLDHLSTELAEKHPGTSWRKIGAEYGISGAMARLIATGYDPGKKIRQKLDLPQSATVIVILGNRVPDGTQVVNASQCSCGQWFVPNHPRRLKCFMCSPYRGRKGALK